MANRDNERLLIISNNVLSNMRNNGKTIYSYIDSIPKENVAQLYFNSEYPSIPGYKYFQITDKDIIKGLLSPRRRGREINDARESTVKITATAKNLKTNAFRLARELLWKGKWRSKKLMSWLDEFSPTAVFFVGGDSVFAYDICQYIVTRYGARLSMYITDDYIMPRTNNSLIGKFRQNRIKKSIKKCLEHTDSFFTVSDIMRKEYQKVFGRDSFVIVNLSESLKTEIKATVREEYTLIYAGSLYYGRDALLGKIAYQLSVYNQNHEKKARLEIYSVGTPDKSTRELIEVEGASEFCGSLNKDELRLKLNESDVLVFVESFDEDQIEKTRYSLSTKVPEYLSAGKPILAVGPIEVGSMDYLSDVAICVTDLSKLGDILTKTLESPSFMNEVAQRCEEKYNKNHRKDVIQQEFISKIFKK